MYFVLCKDEQQGECTEVQFQLHHVGPALAGVLGNLLVCLKLNQSRNISVMFGVRLFFLNIKVHLWVTFPLKVVLFQRSKEIQHFVVACPRNAFLL